jgi:hypothetical protein
VQPEKTEVARAAHVQGEVTIKVTIDPFVANHEPTTVETTFVLDCSRVKKEKTITCWQR